MTVKDFLLTSERILNVFNEQSEFYKYLAKISSYNSNYLDYYKSFRESYNPGSSSTTHNQVQKVVQDLSKMDKEILTEIRKYKPIDIFTFLQKISSDLESLDFLKSEIQDFIHTDSRQFIDAHTDVYSERKFGDIINFISACIYFKSKLEKLTYASIAIKQSFQPEMKKLAKLNKVIDIQIVHSEIDIKIFLGILNIIDNFYTKSCQAFNIHISDYPLAIIKIESGSIWSKLTGHESIVKLISDLLQGLGTFLRDLITGKISREILENKAHKTELIMELIAKAEKMDIPKENKVLLNKVLESTINDLAKAIPKSTSTIMVDDRTILSLEPDEQKKLPGAKKALLMTNKTEEGKQ